MKFQSFCDRLVQNTPAFTSVCDDLVSVNTPEKYIEPIKVLISMMKNKRDIFDRTEVPFVEMVLNNVDISKVLDEKLTDGEVPNGIINDLSWGIFKTRPSELNADQTAIIKVLSVYICIQN